MSSLLTNTSAMVALQTLRSINMSLDQTNNRVSTGLRVSSAADNAAYWSIATTLKSDNSSLSAVQDSLGLGASTLTTTYTGLNSAKDVLSSLKDQLTTATGANVDKDKIQSVHRLAARAALVDRRLVFVLWPELAVEHRRLDDQVDRLVVVARFEQSAS